MAHTLHEMAEAIQEVREGLSEQELLSHSRHKRLEHWILLARNAAVALAMVLFLLSLFHFPYHNLFKSIAYFLGAAAYLGEVLILTDCFRTKVPHREMFMAYCFGPMYILLGISYLAEHL